jgi:hypothetical protein
MDPLRDRLAATRMTFLPDTRNQRSWLANTARANSVELFCLHGSLELQPWLAGRQHWSKPI